MSKWEEYQWLTTTSKKVGGPKVLMSMFASGGAIAGAGIIAIMSKIKKRTKAKNIFDEHKIYRITKSGKISDNYELNEGTAFVVLGRDQDGVVIMTASEETPIVAKYEMIIEISNYQKEDEIIKRE